MDAFPVEIHSYIFQFACTDDGRTARSLGLVSKYYREVVHPFQYQSIAVSGQFQVSELECRLERTLPHMRRVRNIFISDSAKDNQFDAALKSSAFLIMRLLDLVSSSIETLALHCDNPRTSTSLLAFLFGLYYPHLCELIVVGYYPFPHIPNAMPRLKYLHLSGNRNPHGLLQMGNLTAACPSLTHLCISGLSRATAFAAELAEAIEGDDSSQSLFNTTLPPNVRHVVVQPGLPTQMLGKFVSARLSDECMMAHLRSLVGDETTKRKVQFTLLERSKCGETVSTSKRRWMERLDGWEEYLEVFT